MAAVTPPSAPLHTSRKTAYTATAIAAFVESFYRSIFAALMAAQLDGKGIASLRLGTLFPQMHVQASTRVFYITGIKELRSVMSVADVNSSAVFSPAQLRALYACVPGICLCPLSSVLDAAHSRGNAEPLAIRWTRGFTPRLLREIIFGIGINQISDVCRERCVPAAVSNAHVRTAVGSIVAGMGSALMSQVPHNLATMKLLDPKRTYGELWNTLWVRSLPRVPAAVPEASRNLAAQVLTVIAPIGALRRCTQIAGSFVIINGLVYTWRDKPWP